MEVELWVLARWIEQWGAMMFDLSLYAVTVTVTVVVGEDGSRKLN